MKKIYVTAAIAVCLTTAAAQAQQAKKGAAAAGKSARETELKQEITLEKDFVPVEKKATKKNTLPRVKKAAATQKVTLSYSNWAAPTLLPAQIPTMLPYGYRTMHNFASTRGYAMLGAGTQLNMTASAGYRLIDNDTTVLKAWFLHNSTWSGKNTSKLVADNAMRLKQRYNDNTFGIDLSNRFSGGTLKADALAHYDNFNYYGGQSQAWDDNKQTIFTARIGAGWDGMANLSEGLLNYRLALHYNYTGLNRGLGEIASDAGLKENSLQFAAGFDYDRTAASRLGIDMHGNFVNIKANGDVYQLTHDSSKRSYGVLTLTPFYHVGSGMMHARLGANVDFSFSDGAKIRLSPAVRLEFGIADGAAIYIDAQGGKRLNLLDNVYRYYRYSTPQEMPQSTFVPVDAEAGFNIGPFRGFTLRLYGGYGITNGALLPALVVRAADGTELTESAYAYANYIYPKVRGYKVGAELNYEYRSLIELNAKATYAPQSDTYKSDGYMNGYFTGIDRAKLTGSADVKVRPIRQLSVGLGLDFRTGRSQWCAVSEVADGESASTLKPLSLDDVMNLRASANYRFSPAVNLWVEAGNLLNRQWDVIAGQGAQKLNVMGGVGFVF